MTIKNNFKLKFDKKIDFFYQNILKLIQNTQFYHVIAINVN